MGYKLRRRSEIEDILDSINSNTSKDSDGGERKTLKQRVCFKMRVIPPTMKHFLSSLNQGAG